MRAGFSILFFLLNLIAFSQEISTPTTNPTPIATPNKISMGGKFGFGLYQADADYPGPSIRYWLSDQTALEAFGAQIPNVDYIFVFGLGVKTNLSIPTRNLMVQGILQASYTHTGYLPFFTPNDEYDLFTGVGFEAFMPFCDWLSVENAVLLDFSWRPSPYGQVIGIFSPTGNSPVISPLNLSIHAYF